jgi:putative (di)nucleoside polyphosphate hydrolase
MLVYNHKLQLLMGERHGKADHWQFPQGGVERGASLRQTVIRELKEELGIPRRAIGAITRLDARHEYIWKKVPAYAKGKWDGQSQTFWLVEFVGSDEDIRLDASDDQEFDTWRWCSVATVRRIAASERRAGYEGALREFGALSPELRGRALRGTSGPRS